MEWKEKFHSILEETERNLAKAKDKLVSKSTNSPQKICIKTFKSQKRPTRSTSTPRNTVTFSEMNFERPSTLLPDVNTATSMQVLQMQEQIASQNRMIEKLQRLVKTLDSEREFYKEEISVLKRDIDVLSNTMRNQPSLLSSELKVSNVKNEVMQEINKVKAMMHNFERDSNKRSTPLSPSMDSDLWDIKENLTDNLEDVRFQLSQMKRRIDHMENRLASTRDASVKPDRLHKSMTDTDYLLYKPLYTPTSGVLPSSSNSDLPLLRLTISSLKEKLDSLERSSLSHLPPLHQSQPLASKSFHHPSYGNNFTDPYASKYSTYNISSAPIGGDDHYDNHSLSDLSDLSHLSEDEGNFDDLDIDLLTLEVNDGDDNVAFPFSHEVESLYTGKTKKRGKVEFDLDDLELSDLDDDENINLDSYNFDLDD